MMLQVFAGIWNNTSLCGIELKDHGVPGRGLGERLGLDDIISVLRQGGLQ